MIPNQQKQQTEEAYSNFINSINSEFTRKEYNLKFNYFMQFCNLANHQDMVLISESDLESRIRDYIIYLRHDKRLAPTTVSSYITPIAHFYEMNGFTLHWKRLKKFKAKHYSVIEDKPYSREQIKTLIDAAPLRDKCIILLMSSAGLRRGALSYLRIRDLQKIDKYQLYRINVYKKEQESYITFCTPECAKYIDQYPEWCTRIGEILKPNSPLFRIEFDTATEYNTPKAVSTYVVAFMVHKLLYRTGIRLQPNNHTQRTRANADSWPTKIFQNNLYQQWYESTLFRIPNGTPQWPNQVILQTNRSGTTRGER